MTWATSVLILVLVTRDSDTTFKVKGQSSRSAGRFGCLFKKPHYLARRQQSLCHHSVTTCGERGNVLAVGNYCYVAVCLAAQGASVLTEGGEGRGHIVAAVAYSLFIVLYAKLDRLVCCFIPL